MRWTDRNVAVDYSRFYSLLFEPLVSLFGPLDPDTLVAMIGFDAGGPLNFCTRGLDRDAFPLYVSCELAVRQDQVPASFGRYELLAFCDDEAWVRSVLTRLGGMSLDVQLDDGHTVDISSVVEESSPVQGVILEKLYSTEIDGATFGIVQVVGISSEDMVRVHRDGVDEVVRRLETNGRYPKTSVRRS